MTIFCIPQICVSIGDVMSLASSIMDLVMGPIEAVLDVLLAPVYDQINELLPGKRSLHALTV